MSGHDPALQNTMKIPPRQVVLCPYLRKYRIRMETKQHRTGKGCLQILHTLGTKRSTYIQLQSLTVIK